MFDTTYRIPMIIKDPGSNRKNEEDNNFVYLHDLTPTCNDVAGKRFMISLMESRFFLF